MRHFAILLAALALVACDGPTGVASEAVQVKSTQYATDGDYTVEGVADGSAVISVPFPADVASVLDPPTVRVWLDRGDGYEQVTDGWELVASRLVSYVFVYLFDLAEGTGYRIVAS